MLHPLRIDASATDGSARLVDTMLIDPSCLPIPLSSAAAIITEAKESMSVSKLMDQTIIQNAEYLASTLIADMEVYSITRANKTSRYRLGKSMGLKERVENQIRDQLRVIFHREEEEIFLGTKRSSPDRKRQKTSMTPPESTSDGVTDIKSEKKVEEKEDKSSSLVKIKIRIRESGISIIDEFMVDPNHPMSNPIILARSIAKDLNLSSDGIINSIAISIAEQLCGLKVDEDIVGMMCIPPPPNANVDKSTADKNQGGSSSSSKSTAPMKQPGKKQQAKRQIPSAWTLDEKEDNGTKSNYIRLYKPKK